jgi:hypothetical protein
MPSGAVFAGLGRPGRVRLTGRSNVFFRDGLKAFGKAGT